MRTALKAAAYESQHGGADIHGVRPQQGLGGGHHIINQQHTAALQGGQARQKLGAEADRLQGIFITLDPARDTPEVLKAYVTSFDESFIALTPRSPQELAALAREFKIFYRQTRRPVPLKTATRSITPPPATCMTRKAACACIKPTASALTPWRPTRARCCTKKARIESLCKVCPGKLWAGSS